MDSPPPDDTPVRDALDEARSLARGLAAHARRAAASGRERTRAPRRAAPQSPPSLRAQPAASAAPARTPPPAARGPAAPAPAPARQSPTVLAAAAEVRAKAAACSTLEELRAAVAGCTACELCKTRTQTVFMDGQGTRRVLFVGEAPGADEDRTGVPFVGRSGQLLTDIITKGMGLARDEVWIANVLKCRPPENRDPTPDEKATCTPFLDRQIELMDPAVIIPLGKHAAMHVLGIEATMGAMRGEIHTREGRPIVPTYHPSYLLRSPGEKKECWKDIKKAMGLLGLPIPLRGPSGT